MMWISFSIAFRIAPSYASLLLSSLIPNMSIVQPTVLVIVEVFVSIEARVLGRLLVGAFADDCHTLG